MKRSKHGLFAFPPKKTLIWRTHCSIGQSCRGMTSNRSIDWFLESSQAWSFFTERSLNQPKATLVCIRSINQSNRSISLVVVSVFFRPFSFQGHTNIALTVRQFRRLAVQRSVWTERNYWMIPRERSVRWNSSAGRKFVRSRANVTWNSLICSNTLHKFQRWRENGRFCSLPLGLSRSTLWLCLFYSGT